MFFIFPTMPEKEVNYRFSTVKIVAHTDSFFQQRTQGIGGCCPRDAPAGLPDAVTALHGRKKSARTGDIPSARTLIFLYGFRLYAHFQRVAHTFRVLPGWSCSDFVPHHACVCAITLTLCPNKNVPRFSETHF
jgi:hypothetical protein